MTHASTTRSTADKLAELAVGVLGGPLPIRVRAWDGSEAGPAAGPVLVLRNRRAARRMLRSPVELGLAQAYLAGDVELEGDLADGLSALWSADRSGASRSRTAAHWPQLLAAVRLGVLGPRPPAPPSDTAATARRHRPGRVPTDLSDDVPNEFFQMLLDPSMTYSCGYFADGPAGGLAAAQQANLEMICRKLALRSGDRHLDIGCGWGSLICHAAEHHGTSSTGITFSRRQYEYVSKRVADAGLADRVQVRLADHRELDAGTDDGRFDAVSAIEVGEYVDDEQYPAFAATLHRVLRPGGRALVQQLSLGGQEPAGGVSTRAYLAPDLHLRPLGSTVSLLTGAGLQVRDVQALREHYACTTRAWADTLEASWNGAVDLIGEVGARRWRLLLVGAGVACTEDRLGVEQILAVRGGEVPGGEVRGGEVPGGAVEGAAG